MATPLFIACRGPWVTFQMSYYCTYIFVTKINRKYMYWKTNIIEPSEWVLGDNMLNLDQCVFSNREHVSCCIRKISKNKA